MKKMQRIARTTWGGRKGWPSWELVVWRLSLIGALLWIILGFCVAFLMKPDEYIDVPTLKCEEVIILDDYGQSLAYVLGCPGEKTYQCTRMSGTLCASQLFRYQQLKDNQVALNDTIVFEHIVSVIVGTFGILITYFVTLGGILALTDRFLRKEDE